MSLKKAWRKNISYGGLVVRKIYAYLGALTMIFALLAGCAQPATEGSTENFPIEIEDSYGNKYSLTEADLYYNFYTTAQASGVLVSSWDNPSDISPEYLTNFFANHTNWVHTDAEIIILPQEAVEQYICRYFNVQPDHLRKSAHYQPNQAGYELPLVSAETSVITKAATQGNLLTIFYETYYYSPEKADDNIATQGNVTIEIQSYPVRFQYISNVITFDADGR